MFCQNVNHDTQIQSQYNWDHCAKPQSQVQHVFQYNQPLIEKEYQHPQTNYNQLQNPTHRTMDLLNQNTKRQTKQLEAIQRNQHISSLLTVVIAFSQRIQRLKQKICGYPLESFSPASFFNVLDLNQKGYVDINDVWHFINNPKVRQKDILILFKRVNGDHCKDCTRLSYFGYLNLIKPYFNEKLAKQILSRDTLQKAKRKSYSNEPDQQVMQATQETVLLLFQELLLLHCIGTTQHELAKQMLIQEHMLNTSQIKEIIGLQQISIASTSGLTVAVKMKKPSLSLIYDFISNNSQYGVELTQMKFLLAYLQIHQFNLSNDKYLSQLFLPTNYSAQLLKDIKRRKKELSEDEPIMNNYMNTYITKENLIGQGNRATLNNFLYQRTLLRDTHQFMPNQHYINEHSNMIINATSKPNFLEFVHPQSIQRPQQPIVNNPSQLLTHPSPKIAVQHPEIMVNVSNKSIQNRSSFKQNQSMLSNNNHPRQSFLTKNRKPQIGYLNPPQNHQNQNLSHLNKQFYHQDELESGNIAFLGQFMKESNIQRNMSRYPDKVKVKVENSKRDQSAINSSYANSESAFEVVDYGYEPSKYKNPKQSYVFHNSNRKRQPQNIIKKQGLDSRYNMLVSQYKDNVLQNTVRSNRRGLQTIQEQMSNQKSNQYRGNGRQSYYDKSQKQHLHPILERSKANYLNSVSMSQSGLMAENKSYQNFNNNNSSNMGGVLDAFMKH